MADHTIWGVVYANGSVASGSGDFRVDHLDKGLYTILFENSFARLPAVVTTQLYPNQPDSHGGDPRDNSVVVYITEDYCRVMMGTDGGDMANRDFSFIAMGQAGY